MNITLRQLRAFVTVADIGSFTDGAKRLHLTQSALSALVKELEDDLGIKLLDRTTRNVQISSAGKEFYPLAVKVLQDMENAVAAATSLRNLTYGSVRIATTLLYASTVVSDAIASFRSEHPNIRIQLIDTLTQDVLAKVSSEEVEIGVAPQWLTEPEIVRMPLLKDSFVLFCCANHALAKKDHVSWSDINKYELISLTRGFTTRLQLDLVAWSKELLLHPSQEVSYVTTALSLVKAGLGVTALLVSAKPLADAYNLLALPLNDPTITREICIFTKRGRTLSPSAQAFIELLHNNLQH